MKKLQQTTDKPFPIVPLLIAGGILTFFSLKHFGDTQHLANICNEQCGPGCDC
ncbi:hypothetical protein OAG71_00155 [bacterium]|nr:hypothetical protein [bacterium]